MKRKYWHLISIHTCPICGHERVYRTRCYTPKPTDSFKRYEWVDIVYHCNY